MCSRCVSTSARTTPPSHEAQVWLVLTPWLYRVCKVLTARSLCDWLRGHSGLGFDAGVFWLLVDSPVSTAVRCLTALCLLRRKPHRQPAVAPPAPLQPPVVPPAPAPPSAPAQAALPAELFVKEDKEEHLTADLSAPAPSSSTAVTPVFILPPPPLALPMPMPLPLPLPIPLPPPPPAPAAPPAAEVDDADLCVVCLDEPRSIVVLPCVHFVLCSCCVPAVRQLGCCPVCRAAVTDLKPLYR